MSKEVLQSMSIDNLLTVESRDVRVLSMDETAKAGGGLIAMCTILSESSAMTVFTPELTSTTLICAA